MKPQTHRSEMSATRREFLKKSGTVAAAGALAGAVVPRVHAAENNTCPAAAGTNRID